MRRSPDADNGVTELMVSAVMARAAELGVRRVSLNFAVFRSAFEEGARIGAGPGPAAVAAAAARRVALVAVRVALPLQREVPPGVAAAVPVLRRDPRHRPGRHGARRGRGVHRPARASCGRRSTAGRRPDVVLPPAARRPGAAGRRRPARGPRVPEQVRLRMARASGCSRPAPTRTRPRSGRTRPRRDLDRRPALGRAGQRRRPGGGGPRPRRGAVRRSCATGPATSSCC